MKSLRLLTVPLLVLLLAGIAAAQSPAAFSLLIHPREAVLNHGQGIKFEAQIFSVTGFPVPAPKYTWRVEPDSMGRITDDGFFIAGRQDGEATIVCIAEFGMPMIRLIGKAHVVIGRPSDPPIKVLVVPENAVVPPGGVQDYHVTFVTASNRHIFGHRLKWLVEPRHLGEISPDGLFKAGPEVGQGHIIALVEIEGAIYRGAARVTVAQKPSGIISGQVVDEQTAQPLQNGWVWAELIGPIEWRVEAQVDNMGNYVLRRLIPGLYVVRADAKDYLPEFYDNVAHFDEATPVQVAAHDSIPGINFSLSMGGSIAGFIGADAGSGPIAGAHVVAIHVLDPRKSRHAVTDDNGAYKITGLTTGTYAVAADAPGYKEEFYDDAKNILEADLIAVQEPEAITGIDLYLATGSAIAGNVSNSAGGPLAKAMVRIQALIGDRPHFFREVLTDENGNYIASVPPGFYLVHVSARGYLGEYYDNVRDYHDATPVQVFENTHTVGIDFALDPLSTISGKVVDASTREPIVEARVLAFPEFTPPDDPTHRAIEARYPLEATTDALGNYTIENVKPGKYYVRAEAHGYLPEFWQEAENLSGATLVEVAVGTNVTGIDFTLEKGGAISGNVFSAEDTPLQGAVVKVWAATGNAIHRAVTDENGFYRLSGLRTGDYYVHAAAEGYEGLFYDGVKNREDATLVHVEAPNETSGIDFYLPKFQSRLGSIAGVITSDADGPPIPHAFVLAIPIVPGQAHFDLTDPFGFYRINGLPAGNYVVLAWAPGYVGEFYDNVRNWAQATPVAVVANTETGDINFGLATSPRGPYRIAGRLRRAATNAPVANGVIYAFTADGQVASTVTNADGSYVLDEMPAGSYKIMASTSESPTAFYGGTNAENASSVEVGNGQSAEDVDFNIEGTTGVDDTEGVIPSTYGLEQNYPNPFNPETTIKYQLAGKSEVSLKVYNLLGQEVATLVNTTQEPGVYRVQWNGTNRLGQKVATGVYLFQLKAGDFTMMRKMVMMK